jgi:hypothetical protein
MAGRKRGPTHFAPSGLTPEEAREDIKEILKAAKEQIQSEAVQERFDISQPFSVTIYTHINSDNTVDGELRITDVPEDVPIRIALIALTENQPVKTIPGLWTSIGLRFEDIPGAELGKNYTRFRGLNQESSYYGRASKDLMERQRLIVQSISTKMEASGIPRARQIYIRVHWNKMNVKPGERYDRKVKK